jgi:hypothetical protein
MGREGWHVFDVGGWLQVQRDDAAGILDSDSLAIACARDAGLPVDNEGYLIDEEGVRYAV